jgi:uncharacterized protein YndB with AHSA1/START domain
MEGGRGEPIRRRVTLAASPLEVWDALLVPERLGAWFGAEVELEPRAGGAIAFRMPDGTARRGVVEAVDPPRRFAFRWRSVSLGPDGVRVGDVSRVAFELELAGAGRTTVTVTESPGVLAPDIEMLLGSGSGGR